VDFENKIQYIRNARQEVMTWRSWAEIGCEVLCPRRPGHRLLVTVKLFSETGPD